MSAALAQSPLADTESERKLAVIRVARLDAWFPIIIDQYRGSRGSCGGSSVAVSLASRS